MTTVRMALALLAMAAGLSCKGDTGQASMRDASSADAASPPADAASPDVASPGLDTQDATTAPDQGEPPDGANTPDVDDGRPVPRTWTREASVGGRAMGGTGPTDVWIVGDGGEAWNSQGDGQWVRRRAETDWKLTGVWGTAPNDVYVSVEANLALHWNGQGWEKQFDGIPIGAVFDTIWGTGPKDIYLAGPNLYRSMGDGKWVVQQFGDQVAPFVDLWASGPTDVWALGSRGVLRSKGDGVWRAEQTGKNIAVRAIWGSGPTDVYAVYGGSLLHTTGNGTWVVQNLPDPEPTSGALVDVWGSGPNDVYVIGSGKKSLFRSTGNGRWFAEPAPTTNGTAIWGTGRDNVYLMVLAGAVYRSR